MKASRSNKCTSCSFLMSAPCSGGISFFGFLILAATGVWLAQFYHPTPGTARESVVYIMNVAPLGDVVRGIHFWVANIVMATVLLHLGRVFVTGAYKRPREANWLIGLGLLAVTLGLIFTGTVLKWDQEGFEALGHNIEIGNLLGGLGFWFSPEFAGRISILLRLYGAHVVIIPGIILVLLVLHLLLVKRHRMSPHPLLPAGTSSEQAAEGEPTQPFTRHIRRLVAFGIALAGILGVLAVLFPAPIGSTPVPGIEITKPPWMFWWPFTLENWFGLSAIVWGELVFFFLLAVLPFVDRGPERWWRRRPVAMGIALVVLAVLTVLTILMAITPAEVHL